MDKKETAICACLDISGALDNAAHDVIGNADYIVVIAKTNMRELSVS